MLDGSPNAEVEVGDVMLPSLSPKLSCTPDEDDPPKDVVLAPNAEAPMLNGELNDIPDL